MRTVDKIHAAQEYFKYFQSLIADQRPARIWQLDENSHKRSLYRVTLLSCRREENVLKAESLEKFREFALPEKDVYFYVESFQLLFKAPKLQVDGLVLTGELPEVLKILDEKEHEQIVSAFKKMEPIAQEESLDYSLGNGKKKKGYSFEAQAGEQERSERDKAIFENELSFVTLDEEDRLYADKRDAPRARPPEGKMVTMQLADGSKPAGAYSLFDLSRGGLAILTFSDEDFNPGDIVHIQAFDQEVLDSPMVAEIKSVRSADDQGVQYKVGMMFI